MPKHTRHRLVLPLAALMAVLLTGCQLPLGRQAPSTDPGPTAPAPSASTQAPAQTSPAKNPLVFTRTELFSGEEISFPAASTGRVAALLFFSTG